MKPRVFERVLSGQAAAIRLSGSVCYHSLCNALGIDVPWSAVGRAPGPSAHGPHGMKESATVRNSDRSGQLEGRCMRMRAACSITRAPILIRRSRIVANSALASELVWGMAARTLCISQNDARPLRIRLPDREGNAAWQG